MPGTVECKWCGEKTTEGAVNCPLCGRPLQTHTAAEAELEEETARPASPESEPGALRLFIGRLRGDPWLTAIVALMVAAGGLAGLNGHLFTMAALVLIGFGLAMFHWWAYVVALFAAGIGLASSLMSLQLGVGVAVFQGKEAGFDPLVWAVDVGAKVFVLIALALRRSDYF